MGSIETKTLKNGTVKHMARIRIMRDGITHKESGTFDRKAAAQAWVKRREVELSQPGALEALKRADPPLSDVIDLYLKDYRRAPGKTKSQVLRTIKTMPLAALKCSEIDSKALVDFARSIPAQPQTVGGYFAHLSTIFMIARPAWNFPLDAKVLSDARIVTNKLGLTGKSKSRSRRPTLDELDRIMEHFGGIQKRQPKSNPMQRITTFAIFSARRLEEITRMRWEHLDVEGKRVMVTDMKNPGQKIGNDVWCDLPQPALDIILAMPRTEAEIFPYGVDGIGAAFTRAVAFLAIDDLRFHDLRHEGASRLFEMGLNIPQVSAVTGHRSWSSLKRYTHMRQTGDKFAGWKWLPIVTTPMPEIERRYAKGAEWYATHEGIFNPAIEGRGRKPARPVAAD